MTSDTASKRTPLYDVHCQLQARIIPFGGWDMPVSYSGIIEEHLRVRSHAGLFDVSHMGEVEIHGPNAEAAVQYLTLNDVRTLQDFQLQYSALCNASGGLIDDITICRLAADRFLLVINAGNIDKDVAWIQQHLPPGAEATNLSDHKALLALQGPEAETILQRLTTAALPDLGYYCATTARVAGVEALISRLGYTGEDGFELMVDGQHAVDLWQAIMEAGQPETLLPVGLGARDTLRLEARYLLYGADMDESNTPFEVGLSWLTKLDKGPFIGREALIRVKAEGVRQRLVGFVLQDRGIARAHYRVMDGETPIGTVTSGTMSPSLERAIGTAFVPRAYSKIGSELAIEVRHHAVPAEVVRAPFVPHRVKRS
jgi:aminomethyltransferase